MPDITDFQGLPMLTNQSALNAVSDAVPIGNARQHWHGVVFDAATATGVVTVETAPTANYSGLWNPILTCDAAVKKEHEISYPGPGGFVRHRVSTVLAGGNVNSTTRRVLFY